MAEKRKFVTLKDITGEKERRMSSRKKLQFGSNVVNATKEGTTSKVNVEEEIEHSIGTLRLSEYLKKFEIPAKELENNDENQGLTKNNLLVNQMGKIQGCNQYEMNRNKRVALVQQKVDELGLKRMSADLFENKNVQKKKGKDKVTADADESESEFYFPNNELERESDEEDIVTSKKKKVRRVEVGAGPRTGSQANKFANSCDKEATSGSVLVEDKYMIAEEAKKWVFEGMDDQFRTYKIRIMANHYTAYKSDEERLINRPREVPLSDFKILLKYWGDEKVQQTAERNKKARIQVVDRHTNGPRSFAQVCYNMVPEGTLVDAEGTPIDAENPLSDAQVFIKTRKRDPNHQYKLSIEAVTKTISDAENILKAGGSVDAANKVVHSNKEHSSSFLVGRCIKKKETKEKAATSSVSGVSDQYVADLTAKIRAELVQEMDEKVDRKIQEMMKKLAEKNSKLKVNIDE